jgi:mRNA interferase MazF
VVVQHDRFNNTTLGTVVVAAITSTLRLAALPGNVRLAKGEAGLSKACVVNVTQLVTVEKVRLTERLGHLSQGRQEQIVEGLELLLGGDAVLQ